MQELIDSLSKRLATAVSRRDMLRIGSQTFLAAFVSSAGIGKLWAAVGSSPGGVNSSACGAVQRSIQLAIGDNCDDHNSDSDEDDEDTKEIRRRGDAIANPCVRPGGQHGQLLRLA